MFKNRLLTLIVFAVLIYLIIFSIRSVFELRKAGNIVLEYEKELEVEDKRNKEFKKRLEKVKKPEFIEREAREKLGMGKPGESIVIMPKITIIPKKAEERKLANWEKWWKLFF